MCSEQGGRNISQSQREEHSGASGLVVVSVAWGACGEQCDDLHLRATLVESVCLKICSLIRFAVGPDINDSYREQRWQHLPWNC